jgi:hypothetical protein
VKKQFLLDGFGGGLTPIDTNALESKGRPGLARNPILQIAPLVRAVRDERIQVPTGPETGLWEASKLASRCKQIAGFGSF